MDLHSIDDEIAEFDALAPVYGPYVRQEPKRVYIQNDVEDLDRTLVRISEYLKGEGYSDELSDAIMSVKPHKAAMSKSAKVRLLAKLRILVMDHALHPLVAVARFDR